jgi:murein DD-endopeptidase MepM/ murein hydrolase activator NlpD
MPSPSKSACIAFVCLVHVACAGPARPVAPSLPPSECREAAEKASGGQEKRFEAGKPPLPGPQACLDWPMGSFRKITSTFMDPRHPFVPGRHDGTDIYAPVGTSVLAPSAGEVTWTRAVGPCQDAAVAVRYADGWVYEFHHLSRVDVAVGDKVVHGQRLGLSGGAVDADGSGPWTTGPHLHFSLSHEGAYVDAAQYLCP